MNPHERFYRSVWLTWVSGALLALFALSYATADQRRQMEIALALATSSQPQESIVKHRPNCTWIADKQKVSPDSVARPDVNSPALSDAANAAPRQPPVNDVASQVTDVASQVNWVSWQDAERLRKSEQRPSLFFFSTAWCKYCPTMLKHFSHPTVVEALGDMSCVKLGAAEAQMWHVGSFPTVIFVDGQGTQRGKLVGLVSADKLAAAIQEFSESRDAYYPARGGWWTLRNKTIGASHLITHPMHAWRNYDPGWIKQLSHDEQNSLHSDDHEHKLKNEYVRYK